MHLVPNWKSAWKWLSVQFIGLALIWESIPDDAKAAVLSTDWQDRATFTLIILAGIGRMVDQGTAK